MYPDQLPAAKLAVAAIKTSTARCIANFIGFPQFCLNCFAISPAPLGESFASSLPDVLVAWHLSVIAVDRNLFRRSCVNFCRANVLETVIINLSGTGTALLRDGG